jgi:DNA-binding LacI/PurR family transcriptional regulator
MKIGGTRCLQVDLARELGLHQGTVSRALRDDPRVSAVTRVRILNAARRRGYVPDPALSRLAQQRWPGARATSGTVLAFVTALATPLKDSTMTRRVLEGVRQQAAQLGYHVDHFSIRDYHSPKRLVEVVEARGIRGILLGKQNTADLAEAFDWTRFFGVGCDLGYFRPPLPIVMMDYFGGLLTAWERVRARGWRRIGLALLREDRVIDELWKRGAWAVLQESVPTRERIPLCRFAFGEREVFLRWFHRWHPEVVLGFNDQQYWWLKEAGVRIPEDTGFAALIADMADPSLSGLLSHPEEVGARAVEVLDSQLRTHRHGTEAPTTILVPQLWQDGKTVV